MEGNDGLVLVIDDEPAVAHVLQAFLTRAGLQVETAASAEAAKVRLRQKEFDVIVVDILLPGQSGIEFLKTMRELGVEAAVVMITGEPSLESAVHALQEGAYDFLVKPVQRDHLVHTVRRGIEKHRLQQEKRRLEEENRAYQRELEAQNQSLEEKVKERTQELSDYIAQLHQMQQVLLQSEKLASLGQLTAGLAHELNNPLAFARSNLSRIKEYSEIVMRFLNAAREGMATLEKSSDRAAQELAVSLQARALELDLDYILADCKAIVRESIEGVDRAVAIVRDLHRFSHPEEETEEECDLNEILETALTLTSPLLKNHARIFREYGNLPRILCLPQLLGQVFVNLLLNAHQALDGAGEIKIRTYAEDGQAVAEIQDNGRGIPLEILPRIFDPFFTTKDPGQGTGLGLSISYGIIQRHQGTIEAHSRPGEGMTFIIRLPLAKTGSRTAKPAGLWFCSEKQFPLGSPPSSTY